MLVVVFCHHQSSDFTSTAVIVDAMSNGSDTSTLMNEYHLHNLHNMLLRFSLLLYFPLLATYSNLIPFVTSGAADGSAPGSAVAIGALLVLPQFGLGVGVAAGVAVGVADGSHPYRNYCTCNRIAPAER